MQTPSADALLGIEIISPARLLLPITATQDLRVLGRVNNI